MKALHMRDSDRIESKAEINLSFAVQTYIQDKWNLVWYDDNLRLTFF